MAATHSALCAHGYADLTMREIADEAGVSKAALHYHYDTKAELVASFLDHLSTRFESKLDAAVADAGPPGTDATAVASDRDPARQLFALLDVVAESPAEDRAFRTAMLELEAQAPYREELRERLARFDATIRRRLAAVLASGSDSGVFDLDREPAAEAEFLATIVHGAGTRNVAFGASLARARRSLRTYLRDELLVDPAAHELDDVLVADPVDGSADRDGDGDPDRDQDRDRDDVAGRAVVDEPREVRVE
jgi:AcrR family transcriptional regulator